MTQSDPELHREPSGPPDFALARPVFGTRGESRTSPLTIVADSLTMALSLTVFVLVSNPEDLAYMALTYGVMGAIFGSIQVLQWSHRLFEVTDSELRVRSGVVGRKTRIVPFSRIQLVDRNQKIWHRLLGLAVVQIDTAADSNSTTILVSALPLADADALRDWILQRRHRSVPLDPRNPPIVLSGVEPSSLSPPTILLRIDNILRLALAGVTGTSILLGAFAVIWPLRLALDNGLVNEEDVANSVGSTSSQAWLALGMVFLVLLPLAAAGIFIVRWHGYTLQLIDDDLVLEHGLFERRRLTIPRPRVQQVTISDNPVRRFLGLTTVTLHSAAAGAPKGSAEFTLKIPIIDRVDVPILLAGAMGSDRWTIPPFTRLPPAAFRRHLIRRLAILAPPVAAVTVATRPIGVVSLLLLGAAWPWARWSYKLSGWGTTPQIAALEHGAFLHQTILVLRDRMQSAGTSSSVFQRRVGLMTIRFDVAGQRFAPRLRDIDATDADVLRRQLPSTHRLSRRRHLPASRSTTGAMASLTPIPHEK